MTLKNIMTRPWKEFLPETFHWLESVGTTKIGSYTDNCFHVLGTHTVGTDDQTRVEFCTDTLTDDLKSKLSSQCEALGWQGKGSTLKLSIEGKHFILVPVTKIKTTANQKARQLGIDAAKGLKVCNAKHLIFTKTEGLDTIDIFDGYVNGIYESGIFKTYSKSLGKKSPSKLPEKVSFLDSQLNDSGLDTRKKQLQGIVLSRMVQDAPPNWFNPLRFAEIAEDLCKDIGIKCQSLGPGEMEAMGMGSFLSVAAGSAIEPRLITMEIEGVDKSKTVALVGKGLTFDTGGTSLKPAPGMGEMKYDMSGGGAVLGTAYFLGKVKPPTNVVCLIGAVENMPGGTATRPGDIVVAMNGKSIDVQNTDAEGRLVLADVINYAVANYKPDLMIDIATLTGAVLHALGHTGAAIMSNDQKTADFIKEASHAVGEPLWQLPLWPELDKEVKSEVADLQNISKPSVKAGSIIGGVFLKEFVADTKWAHLDIAATGWSCKATGYPHSGGTGYGIRTMSEVCFRFNS